MLDEDATIAASSPSRFEAYQTFVLTVDGLRLGFAAVGLMSWYTVGPPSLRSASIL
jgi:hypothetical protein